jgi:hypothetical protein
MMRAPGLLTVTLVLLATAVGDAAGGVRYSGTVVAIDPRRGVMIIEEVGPGRGPKAVVTQRTISVTSRTKFNRFIRVSGPGGFAGDFIEVVLDADDVALGEFVTAECVLERGRLVAVLVTLAELAQLPSSPGGDLP